MNSPNRLHKKFITILIPEILSTLRCRVKILFNLVWNWKWLIREGRLLYSYALGHCATVQVWFTPPVSFVYSLSTGDDDQSHVNQRYDWKWILWRLKKFVSEEEFSLTATSAWIIGKISRLTNSSTCCRLTSCKFWKLCINNAWKFIFPVRVQP